jgi:hypothetical protein
MYMIRLMRALITSVLITLGLQTAPLQADEHGDEDGTCKVAYRCTAYQSCLIDDQLSRCSYGSGSSISGGVTFADGAYFEIFWKFVDENGVENPVDDDIALVNDVATKFKVKNEACVVFNSSAENPSFAYGNCK